MSQDLNWQASFAICVQQTAPDWGKNDPVILRILGGF